MRETDVGVFGGQPRRTIASRPYPKAGDSMILSITTGQINVRSEVTSASSIVLCSRSSISPNPAASAPPRPGRDQRSHRHEGGTRSIRPPPAAGTARSRQPPGDVAHSARRSGPGYATITNAAAQRASPPSGASISGSVASTAQDAAGKHPTCSRVVADLVSDIPVGT